MISFIRSIMSYINERAAIKQSVGHPAAGVIGWYDRSMNTSGVDVTEDVALTYSAVWAATRVISETVASLPCILYRRTASGKERATDDPRFSLVHDEPNDYMTSYTFFETTTAHLVLCGNSYSRIRWMDGMPIALDVRLPSTVKVEMRGNGLLYTIMQMDEELMSRDMLHVAGLSSDGITGYGVVRQAAQSIGSAIAAEQYGGAFYGNGAQPAGILSHPQRLSKEQREAFRKDWNEVHQGAHNAHKIAIIHGGLDYKQMGMSHEDAQFLESRQFSITEIARWFRLPPHMLGDLTHATFSNIEHQSLEFVKYSIAPWLRRWETALTKKLLRPMERGTLFFEFLLDALLRGDLASRYSAFATARQWGWLSVNEIRQLENMNAIDNGDVYLQPMNMTSSDDMPEAISTAWHEQHTASMKHILDVSVAMRNEMANGILDFQEASLRFEHELQKRLSGIHDQQAEMRRELANNGSSHQGVDVDGAEKVATEAIKQILSQSMITEGARAVVAAKRQLTKGKSFIGWLDEYYMAVLPGVLAAKIAPHADILEQLGNAINADKLAAEHCERNRQLLLECADGDRDGFLQRVEELASLWSV